MHGITNECTHDGTAAAINDHKTAHKHSNFAPFQAYDNTKKCSASEGKAPPLTPDSCYRLELRARHNMGLYAPPISTPGSAPDWLAVTPADECISVSRGPRRYR